VVVEGVVDLGLRVGHNVGQVLQELHLILEKTTAWPDPLVLVVVHCLSCYLVLGVSLEAEQLVT
jgi:hypothetical protein